MIKEMVKGEKREDVREKFYISITEMLKPMTAHVQNVSTAVNLARQKTSEQSTKSKEPIGDERGWMIQSALDDMVRYKVMTDHRGKQELHYTQIEVSVPQI